MFQTTQFIGIVDAHVADAVRNAPKSTAAKPPIKRTPIRVYGERYGIKKPELITGY